ncbi:sugar porter family MFS transporter [Bifidobacterium sp. CP2]|uniref:sugar porter family MFS transporter n=1 Tax=Bifidobacterium sp. CP2 TaxID=2809025 RepID=UPI001BDCED31|nr:sugar porter family MFS transporter [Bifidobacterium sp. CP2]MBT1180822.1 sugar porter family MFS transporter [Bifidobacterium sp. CP2]
MAGLFHAVSKQQNPLGTAIQMNGSGRYTFGLALSAGLAGLLYGYDTVSISGAIDFLRMRYSLSTTMEGLVISSIIIGAVAGAASAGFLSDRYGRKRILMLGGMFFLVAALWSAFTYGPYDLITARVVGGYGIGLTAALAVTYITESAPTGIRGTLAFSYQLLAVCGIFMTNVINYIIASYGSFFWDIGFGWRWMLGLGAVPAAIFLAAMWHAPESPRFLIQNGHPEQGFAILEQIMGTEKARVRTDDIQASVQLEKEMSNEFTDLFRPGLRKALVIGVFLAVFNQAIGMNAISYYGPVMFSRMGFGGDTEFLASACVGGVELVFTVVGLYLIDSVGRKKLLEYGSMLMFLFAMGIAGSYFSGRSLLTLVFVMLFTSAFAISMGPIPWIVIPELFPTFLRGRATGLCVMCLLVTNGLIAQFTPLMIDRLGGGVTFLIFGVIDLLCLIGVLILVPETMGRTLEEIDHLWQPRTPLAAAKYTLSSADANIRHAEATLARVENERLQAMGIMEAAERSRISAQKTIFAIEAEEREQAERLSAARRAEDARRAAHTVVDDTTSQPAPYPESTALHRATRAVHDSAGVDLSRYGDDQDTLLSGPILFGRRDDAQTVTPASATPSAAPAVPAPASAQSAAMPPVPMPDAGAHSTDGDAAPVPAPPVEDWPDDGRVPDLSGLPDMPVPSSRRTRTIPDSAMPTIPLPVSVRRPAMSAAASAAEDAREAKAIDDALDTLDALIKD